MDKYGGQRASTKIDITHAAGGDKIINSTGEVLHRGNMIDRSPCL